jgi:hypothetical protein
LIEDVVQFHVKARGEAIRSKIRISGYSYIEVPSLTPLSNFE